MEWTKEREIEVKKSLINKVRAGLKRMKDRAKSDPSAYWRHISEQCAKDAEIELTNMEAELNGLVPA